MPTHNHQRHATCFIVPPQILERVILTGEAQDRERALATLGMDHALRSTRIQASLIAQVAPPAHGGTGKPNRTIMDAKHGQDQQSSNMVRSEGQSPVADASANQAYDGFGDTYRFYWDIFGRDSIDDSGLQIFGEVHFGTDYDNAFWNGERMMFGDGDNRLFTGFTSALDVIGHELTHGVTQDTLNLRYLGQSGALNEAISDVFGSMVKQYKLGQTSAQADWLIGSGILGPQLHGTALRSMKAPGTAFQGDNQPATMAGYVRTTSDNGGVHTNSGIPNHAFYLMATALGGHSWEKAGQVWYKTMVQKAVKPTSTFRSFANATIHTATTLFGAGSPDVKAITDAWKQVQVV